MNRLFIATFALAVLLSTSSHAAAHEGYNLFQKGLVQERVEGNLQEAIRLYQQVIDDFGDDRSLAAKALVQMGGCYEKLGRNEAQRAYNRVLDEYPDQSEYVVQARARLAALDIQNDVQQTGMVTQELKLSYMRDLSQSRDGSKLVYTASRDSQENVVMRDLATGQETQVTHYMRKGPSARQPIFSPDANSIAYMEAGNDCYLHIVSLQTGEDRQLVQDQAPLDWSNDGRFILLGWTPERNRMVYSVLSVDSLDVKKLKLELRLDTSDCRFSADAQCVSYSENGSLFLYHIDTDEVLQLTDGSHKDMQPLWCPDGKTVLFLSQRAFGPEQDLCTLSVNGEVAGDVQVIVPDFGEEIRLRSLSQTGRLLYEQTNEDKCVCSISVDAQTGKPLGEVKRMVGGTHPVWSPDGRRIAYIANNMLHVMSADGQEDREIMRVGFHLSGSYGWAADNDTIYMPELQKSNVTISAISVATKEKRTVWAGDGKTGAMHVTCAPDGGQIAFIKHVPNGKYQVFTVDVDGTKLRQLTFDKENNAFYPTWSPDGNQIAYMSRSGDVSALFVVSIADRVTKEVFLGKTPKDRFYHKSWAPDGSKIVWGTQNGLQIGDISTGEYHPLEIDVDSPLLAPCWSPDGSKILFNTTEVEKVMAMDNFLPETDGAR